MLRTTRSTPSIQLTQFDSVLQAFTHIISFWGFSVVRSIPDLVARAQHTASSHRMPSSIPSRTEVFQLILLSTHTVRSRVCGKGFLSDLLNDQKFLKYSIDFDTEAHSPRHIIL